MAELVAVEVEGVTVQVEVPERLQPPVRDVGMASAVSKGLDDALDFVAAYARSAARRLSEALTADVSPDEISLEMGIAVGAESGVVITSGSVEGTLKVTLKWRHG